MPRLILLRLRALFVPEGGGQGGEPRPTRQPAWTEPETSSERERLERITLYARAGYFHMSHPIDLTGMGGEIPLE